MHLNPYGEDAVKLAAALANHRPESTGAECTTIFADTTRTGRQRSCSQRCANRDAVRRHRATQAAGRPRRAGVRQ
ncbi:CGNR zinc finger domain-containing protein [Kitasatospora sp. NPDC050463]|uniref:CGNR zinc finger domain-containing protein n=1 Tax=Kitasatospora sp. NPDC050463 TaxID=3155786 RepID=UPI0033CE23E4